MDRLQKAVLHVEKDVGVPINLFEALRNLPTSTSGTTVDADNLGDDVEIDMPMDWKPKEGKDPWDKLTKEDKQLELLEPADRALVVASKKKVNTKAGNEKGSRGSMAMGYFARKTASRSKNGAKEGVTEKTWMVKTKYLDNSFESSVSSVVNKDRDHCCCKRT